MPSSSFAQAPWHPGALLVLLLSGSCAQDDDWIARPRGAADALCERACGAPGCPCPSARRVPIVAPGGFAHAIDAAERTLREYAAFVAEHASGPGTSAGDVCSWNESYVPAQTSFDLDPNCAGLDWEALLAESPDRPVVCVDWCDARDHCAWSGGRLCGRTAGGELGLELQASTEDEWYVACSAGGTQVYCYGDAFDAGACNTRDSGNEVMPIPIGSMPGCEGPSAGLFDMNGNVDEWIAACEPSAPSGHADATCLRVGGAFYQAPAAESRCDAAEVGLRSTAGNDTGFRCCYDR